MYSRTMFRAAFVVVLLLACTAMTFAARRVSLSDGRDYIRTSSKAFTHTDRNSLDEDYNQFRYFKTTDYGVTWSTRQQAGDLSSFAPELGAFADFGAVVTATNELCYAVVLLEASTPGVYAMVGPNFTPVLVMPQGSNAFDVGHNTITGRCVIGRAPNGTLVIVNWGHDSGGLNTFWAIKSTDNGATWGSPWVIANEAMLGPVEQYSHYMHISERIGNDMGFVEYQTIGETGYLQHVLRFPLTGGLGSITDLPEVCGHPYSYMFASCKPIAYDPDAGKLFACYRNDNGGSPNGMFIYYSDNGGVNFGPATEILHPGQRYPSMALRNEGSSGTPFLIWNMTTTMPVGDPQCAWYSYDEFGYGGNAWTEPASMVCVTRTDRGSVGECIYVNQAYFWDATHGVGVHNGAVDPIAGEIVNTSYSSDGGITWTGFSNRLDFERDTLNIATMQNAGLAGGQSGVAYVAFCGAHGVSDLEVPSVSQMTLLSDPTTTGPYVVKAFYDDNILLDNAGPNGPWVNWHLPGEADTYVTADSMQLTAPERNVGWYYFTIPGGWTSGDSLWFYCDGYDMAGNYNSCDLQLIRVGFEWLGVGENPVAASGDFRLIGNYPNPFNPATAIQFEVPADLKVTLKVYNTIGQEVATLLNGDLVSRGVHRVDFSGNGLASGVYIYTLQAGSFTASQKMVLLK